MNTHLVPLLKKPESTEELLKFCNERNGFELTENAVKYRVLALFVAQRQGMLFGLGNTDEEMLQYLRDNPVDYYNISEITDDINEATWLKYHTEKKCGRWDCPFCKMEEAVDNA